MDEDSDMPCLTEDDRSQRASSGPDSASVSSGQYIAASSGDSGDDRSTATSSSLSRTPGSGHATLTMADIVNDASQLPLTVDVVRCDCGNGSESQIVGSEFVQAGTRLTLLYPRVERGAMLENLGTGAHFTELASFHHCTFGVLPKDPHFDTALYPCPLDVLRSDPRPQIVRCLQDMTYTVDKKEYQIERNRLFRVTTNTTTIQSEEYAVWMYSKNVDSSTSSCMDVVRKDEEEVLIPIGTRGYFTPLLDHRLHHLSDILDEVDVGTRHLPVRLQAVSPRTLKAQGKYALLREAECPTIVAVSEHGEMLRIQADVPLLFRRLGAAPELHARRSPEHASLSMSLRVLGSTQFLQSAFITVTACEEGSLSKEFPNTPAAEDSDDSRNSNEDGDNDEERTGDTSAGEETQEGKRMGAGKVAIPEPPEWPKELSGVKKPATLRRKAPVDPGKDPQQRGGFGVGVAGRVRRTRTSAGPILLCARSGDGQGTKNRKSLSAERAVKNGEKERPLSLPSRPQGWQSPASRVPQLFSSSSTSSSSDDTATTPMTARPLPPTPEEPGGGRTGSGSHSLGRLQALHLPAGKMSPTSPRRQLPGSSLPRGASIKDDLVPYDQYIPARSCSTGGGGTAAAAASMTSPRFPPLLPDDGEPLQPWTDDFQLDLGITQPHIAMLASRNSRSASQNEAYLIRQNVNLRRYCDTLESEKKDITIRLQVVRSLVDEALYAKTN